jgi:hypothetical protein
MTLYAPNFLEGPGIGEVDDLNGSRSLMIGSDPLVAEQLEASGNVDAETEVARELTEMERWRF